MSQDQNQQKGKKQRRQKKTKEQLADLKASQKALNDIAKGELNQETAEKLVDDQRTVLAAFNNGKSPSLQQMHSGRFVKQRNNIKKALKHIPQPRQDHYIARKFENEASRRLYRKDFASLDGKQKLNIVADIIGDDWWDTAKSWVGDAVNKYGHQVLDYFVPGLGSLMQSSGITPGKIYNTIQKGISWFLNDWKQPTFDYDRIQSVGIQLPESKKFISTLDDASSSWSALGVNLKAVCATLAPELGYVSLFPGQSDPRAVRCLKQQVPIITNASGEAVLAINCWNVFGSGTGTGCYAILFNDNALNLASGQQSITPTVLTDNIFKASASAINSWGLIGNTFRVFSQAAILNASGKIIMAANHNGLKSTQFQNSASGFAVGTNALLAQPFAASQSLKDCDMYFRLIPTATDEIGSHAPSTLSDDTHAAQIAFQVSGAPPNSAVAIVEITTEIYYQPDPTQELLISTELPAPGLFTQHLVQQAIMYNPALCLFGKQEITELIEALLRSPPSYDAAFTIMRNRQASIVNFGTGIFTGRAQMVNTISSGQAVMRGQRPPYQLQPSKKTQIQEDNKKEEFETNTVDEQEVEEEEVIVKVDYKTKPSTQSISKTTTSRDVSESRNKQN